MVPEWGSRGRCLASPGTSGEAQLGQPLRPHSREHEPQKRDPRGAACSAACEATVAWRCRPQRRAAPRSVRIITNPLRIRGSLPIGNSGRRTPRLRARCPGHDHGTTAR
jgi:hypothetical protein